MSKEINTVYQYIKVSGSAYEAGRELGRLLKQNHDFINLLTHPFMGQKGLEGEELKKIQKIFETYCPGINDEIHGFADEVGANYGDVVYYFAYLRPMGANCSLIGLSPELTVDGQGMLARNYEFGWDDNSMLIETQIENQYRQIGFGCQLFGRFDGMNEHGLCIVTAAGVINPAYTSEGFVFPVIVRAILNQCKTVEEALQLFDKMQVADYRNFMIMDATGDAVLIEAAAHEYTIKMAGKNEVDKILYATNHYNSESLASKKYYVPKHSMLRYNIIKKSLETSKYNLGRKISNKDVKEVLTKPMPDGVYCPYFEDGMGTMWSIVFYPEQRKMELCFGSDNPKHWKSFDFTKKVENEIHRYHTTLISEAAPEEFWDNLN